MMTNRERIHGTGWFSRCGSAVLLAVVCCGTVAVVTGVAAERVFDFGAGLVDQPPAGFRSALAGTGKLGEWKVIYDEVPPAIAAISPNAPSESKQPVVAQLSRDPTDERFPLLTWDKEVLGDFTLNVKVKAVAGAVEQMAGIAFRVQDEKNFYVARISSLGNTFRFYVVRDGVRGNPIGPETQIPKGVWHKLTVECKGNLIRLKLDDRQLIPDITDNSFSEGKIAFWTKSDSVSYFADLRIDYIPRETLAQNLVKDVLRRYPRLLGIKVYSTTTARTDLHIVASDDTKDLGTPAGQVEKDTIAKNAIFYGKTDSRALVTMPLHDNNGDAIAAVRLAMRSFTGQTEQNAIGRARPIIKMMESRSFTLREFTD